MRLDDYTKLNIKDKKGNLIRLAIESQGNQHNPNEEIGFKAYLALNMFDGVYNDPEWKRLKSEWELLIYRDEFKQFLFDNIKDLGYSLITVDNNLSPEERVNHIINELFDNAEIDLSDLANTDEIKKLLEYLR